MCNKFLTLGFGWEHEEILRFQGRMFFLIFGKGCLYTTIMETRKRSDGDVVVLWLWCFYVVFFYLGWVRWNGYYWILAECEAKELPSARELVELLLWSWRKKNNKTSKWGMGKDWFFRGRLDFEALTKVLRNLLCNVLWKTKI